MEFTARLKEDVWKWRVIFHTCANLLPFRPGETGPNYDAISKMLRLQILQLVHQFVYTDYPILQEIYLYFSSNYKLIFIIIAISY